MPKHPSLDYVGRRSGVWTKVYLISISGENPLLSKWQWWTVLAQNWWVVALRGVLGIIFGVIALIWPGITLLSLVLLFSAYMLVDGILAIVSAVRAARSGHRWLLLVAEGLLRIAVGVLAFLWPEITVLAFVIIMAVWSIVSGSMMVAATLRLNRACGRGWMRHRRVPFRGVRHFADRRSTGRSADPHLVDRHLRCRVRRDPPRPGFQIARAPARRSVERRAAAGIAVRGRPKIICWLRKVTNVRAVTQVRAYQ